MEGGGKLSSRVKVESILSVVSSTPTEAGKTLKFSLLDQAMGVHTLHVVFYYRSNPFKHGPMVSDIDNLRVSLSNLLDEYPIATGRLTRGTEGDWVVKCNDAGVRMLQATVSTTLDEWLTSADASEERDLTVWEDMPQDPTFWSPFRIQINDFKCGGMGIGLSCTHMHADITSVTNLIKSWTEVHRAQPLTHSPIFHLPQLSTLLTSQTISSIPSFLFPSSHQPNMATATMKFSAPLIQKCLSQIQNHSCPNATPFDILVSLFWSRIAKCQQKSQPPLDNHKRSLCICVDSRNSSTVPYGYFGNAFHFSVLKVDADLLLSGELGRLSDCVHRHVAGLKAKDFGSVMSWLEEKNKEEEGPLRIYGPRLTCINVTQDMYGAEFEEGEKPVHVSCRVGNVEGEGLIMVMPSGEGGFGRTVTIVLPEEQIGELCKDQIIQDMEPIMLICGRK